MPVTHHSYDGLDDVTIQLIGAGLPANTRRAYGQDRRDYTAWCQVRGLDPLPALPEQLAAWAAYQLTVGSSTRQDPRPRSPSSVSRSLSGVSTWSVEHRLGRPDLRLARLVLRGWQREHSQSPIRRAAPATPDVLQRLLGVVDHNNEGPTVRGVRDAAIILVAFSVAGRRSEVVALDIDAFTFTPQGMVVRLLRSKTMDRSEQVAVPFGRSPLLCPVRAVQVHLELLGQHGITSGPVFRRITRTGVILERRLQPAFVATLVNSLAERAGIPVPPGFGSWAGHSLRRGCAVALHAAGAGPHEVTRQGGWVSGSNTVADYLVEADQFLRHPLARVL